MKKYKVNEFSIIASLPYSIQISTERTSHRLVDHQDDPDAEYPHEITVEEESLSTKHILMYTPRKYMRVTWFDDPEEPNGSIDMGIRTPGAGLDFVSWLTLTNNVSEELVAFVYLLIKSPDSVKEYEVPLFEPESNENTNTVQIPNEAPPPPPPPAEPSQSPKRNGTPKRRKFKVRGTQRRLRNF